MQVLSWRTISLLAAAGVAVALMTGCGGAGIAPGPPSDGATTPAPEPAPSPESPALSEYGRMTVAVAWPPPPDDMSTRLIPQLSTHVALTVDDGDNGERLVEDTLSRPAEAPWVTEASYDLPASPRALLTVNAYPADPDENPGAVPQAAGSMYVVIPGGESGYPLDGAPGDAVRVVLGSTVARVAITRAEPGSDPAEGLSLLIGSTLQLAAAAYDADDNLILVPGFDWASSSANATVDDSGLVTGRQVGKARIVATEVEAGASGSAVVEVAPPAILGAVSGLGGQPQEHVTVRVADAESGDLVGLTRTGDDGRYRVPVAPEGDYRVMAEKSGYVAFEPDPAVYELRVGTSDVRDVDFTMTAPPAGPEMGEIRGFAFTPEGDPVDGVTVSADAVSAQTDRNGEFVLTLQTGLTHEVTPQADGLIFSPASRQIDLSATLIHTEDFVAVAD